ncbi:MULTISPECIES: 3D domain-containing protein [Brevundimonas]|uniref:3D domain-containing protein n=1 Tax=Brevundimonas TaxID=41275 RepID=UPI000F028D57|nr:3D domain-containing protein [Brevundimonas lutea]
MLTTAAMALFMAFASNAAANENALPTGPVPYEQVVAVERAEEAAELERMAAIAATAAEFANEDADWRLSARLYHAGGGGATGNDSLGCRPVAMRTVATDPRVVPRRTRLFIRETVGMEMPDGTLHDGFWYASDTGGAIKGSKIDLYTGHGRGSMSPAMKHNMKTLTVVEAGTFDGCPPDWQTASN